MKEKEAEPITLQNLVRSYTCSFKMQKIKEDDFEELDCCEDDDYNISDICKSYAYSSISSCVFLTLSKSFVSNDSRN